MRKRHHLQLPVLIFLALVACKDRQAAPAPSASVTAAEAPSASMAAVTPRPAIVPATVKAGTSAEGQPWFDSFSYSYPDRAPLGSTWTEARAACLEAGLDLCSEEQWESACHADPNVGNASSWTMSYASATSWVVRGGEGCASKTSSDETKKAPARIGLCCQRRIGILGTGKSEALAKAANVYASLAEKALNSKSADAVTKVLADDVVLQRARVSREKAGSAIAAALARWPSTDRRFVTCNAHIGGESGDFECDVVMTRSPSDAARAELSVFRSRFEYGPPNMKYSVFDEPVLIKRTWDGSAPPTLKPSPRGTPSDTIVRFKCPGGQKPEVVRTGCLCGSEILNPCKTGGNFPRLEGDTCVFSCPAAMKKLPPPKTALEKCIQDCNEESGWRFIGQCQLGCEAEAK